MITKYDRALNWRAHNSCVTAGLNVFFFLLCFVKFCVTHFYQFMSLSHVWC